MAEDKEAVLLRIRQEMQATKERLAAAQRSRTATVKVENVPGQINKTTANAFLNASDSIKKLREQKESGSTSPRGAGSPRGVNSVSISPRSAAFVAPTATITSTTASPATAAPTATVAPAATTTSTTASPATTAVPATPAPAAATTAPAKSTPTTAATTAPSTTPATPVTPTTPATTATPVATPPANATPTTPASPTTAPATTTPSSTASTRGTLSLPKTTMIVASTTPAPIAAPPTPTTVEDSNEIRANRKLSIGQRAPTATTTASAVSHTSAAATAGNRPASPSSAKSIPLVSKSTGVAAGPPRASNFKIGSIGRADGDRKFKSLADLQQAIKDGEQKKEAIVNQTKVAREQSQATAANVAQDGQRVRAPTRTRRGTISQAATSKINQQLGQFVTMLQALETEFAKGEEQRIKKDEEVSKMRSMVTKNEEQLERNTDTYERLISSITELSMKMDSFSLLLQDVSKNHAKAGVITNEFTSIKENLARVKTATTTSMNTNKEFLTQAYLNNRTRRSTMGRNNPPPSAPGAIPGAPPLPMGLTSKGGSPLAPPPPPVVQSTPRVNPVTALLSQIQTGTQLKKVEETDKNQKGHWKQTANMLQSLQATLTAALEQRREDLEDDEEGEEEDVGPTLIRKLPINSIVKKSN